MNPMLDGDKRLRPHRRPQRPEGYAEIEESGGGGGLAQVSPPRKTHQGHCEVKK